MGTGAHGQECPHLLPPVDGGALAIENKTEAPLEWAVSKVETRNCEGAEQTPGPGVPVEFRVQSHKGWTEFLTAYSSLIPPDRASVALLNARGCASIHLTFNDERYVVSMRSARASAYLVVSALPHGGTYVHVQGPRSDEEVVVTPDPPGRSECERRCQDEPKRDKFGGYSAPSEFELCVHRCTGRDQAGKARP